MVEPTRPPLALPPQCGEQEHQDLKCVNDSKMGTNNGGSQSFESCQLLYPL